MALLLIYNKCITLSHYSIKRLPFSVNLMALLSCYPAEYQYRLNFQKARETSNRNVVLQYSDHPEAPAFRPRPLHVPRHQWWSKAAQTSQCYCLWWVSSADHPNIQEIHRLSSARITHSSHACLIFLRFCDQRILYHRLQNVTAVSKPWRQLS